MTGGDIALIITALGSLLAAMSSAAAVVLGALNARRLLPIAEQVQKIEVATNSMKDRLIEATAKSEHAAGVVVGRAEVVAEQKDKA